MIDLLAAEKVQVLTGDGFNHRFQEHEAQIAIDGDFAGGVFQGCGRGKSFQSDRPLVSRQGQDSFIKRLPGRQAGLVGQQGDEGQTAFVSREPGGQEFSQSGGQGQAPGLHQDQEGQGGGQGFGEGGEVKNRL